MNAFDESPSRSVCCSSATPQSRWPGAQKQDQFAANIATRDLIGQAKGILMERYKINAHTAFALLVRASQHNSRKLRGVATHLSTTGELDQTDTASR